MHTPSPLHEHHHQHVCTHPLPPVERTAHASTSARERRAMPRSDQRGRRAEGCTPTWGVKEKDAVETGWLDRRVVMAMTEPAPAPAGGRHSWANAEKGRRRRPKANLLDSQPYSDSRRICVCPSAFVVAPCGLYRMAKAATKRSYRVLRAAGMRSCCVHVSTRGPCAVLALLCH